MYTFFEQIPIVLGHDDIVSFENNTHDLKKN